MSSVGDSHRNKSLSMFTNYNKVCLCVCLYAQQLPSGLPATLWEPIAPQQSSEGMVTRGWIKQWVFSFRGPLVVAVMCWRCGPQPQHTTTSAPLSPSDTKNTESLWPVFASSLSCRLSLPSLLPPRPTPSERQSAPAGFLDTGSRDGAATSLHPLAFSLSHSLSLSLRLPQSVFCTTALPPLIHQCKSPANFLNKQVRWLLLLSTHIHAGHPSLDLLGSNTLTNIHTHTHALGVPVTHAERCRIDICSMIQIEADRHCLPVCLT